jgi:hypothetical protein
MMALLSGAKCAASLLFGPFRCSEMPKKCIELTFGVRQLNQGVVHKRRPHAGGEGGVRSKVDKSGQGGRGG